MNEMERYIVSQVADMLIKDSCGMIPAYNNKVLESWINWLVDTNKLELSTKSANQLCFELMSAYSIDEDPTSTSLIINAYDLGEPKIMLNEQYPNRIFVMSGMESRT